MRNRLARLYSPGRLTYAILILIALTIPLYVTERYWMSIVTMICIWAIAVVSLDLILGYTGQASLCHAALFGTGAYTSALLVTKLGISFWPSLVAAALAASLLALVIGIPALRARGSYFVICTLGFNIIVTVIISRWYEFTGGEDGICGIPYPSAIGPLSFESMTSRYYLAVFFLLLTIFVVYRLVNSLLGRSFRAIRGNEELAEVIGIGTMRNKVLSFVISAFFAGLAGALYSACIKFISPEITSFHLGFLFLIYLIMGGAGTIIGPVIGTAVLVLIPEFIRPLADYRMIVYGLLLVVIILFMRRGIVGGVRQGWARVTTRVRRG